MVIIDFLNLFHAANILFGSQRLGFHKSLDDFHGDHTADNFCAKAEHVGVIMLTCQLRAERILTNTGIDAIYLVGNHCASVADTIDKDSSVIFSFGDCQGSGIS